MVTSNPARVEWVPIAVDSPEAVTILTEYFDFRAASFPKAIRSYTTVFPTAGYFTPPDGAFLVGRMPGSPPATVACGAIRRIGPAPTGPRFEVKHVWVQPPFRGGGLGRELLLELERRARDYGAADLVLDTHDSLVAAAALYSSLGFERIAPYNDNPNATTWYGKTL